MSGPPAPLFSLRLFRSNSRAYHKSSEQYWWPSGCRFRFLAQDDSPEYVICLCELAASQQPVVAATAFAAIASLLCGTPAELLGASAILLHYSSALLEIAGSPRGLEVLFAADALLPHAPGAVAAALMQAARVSGVEGAIQQQSALLLHPKHPARVSSDGLWHWPFSWVSRVRSGMTCTALP